MSGGRTRTNVDLQRVLYGEPLGDRIRRVINGYGVSQARLADAMGISPTMLSQVMSGRRTKLANPVVLARLAVLERRGRAAPDVGDLAEVRAMSAADAVLEASVADEAELEAGLRHCFAEGELAACASAVRLISPTLAELLARAGGRPVLPVLP